VRFVLRTGTREVLFFTRNRFSRFYDLEQAAEFLASYCARNGNLEALRTAVRGSMDHTHLDRLDDLALLVRVAELLVRGELNVLVDANGLAPWVWTFPRTPSVQLDEAGVEGEFAPLEGEGDETEDSEAEFEDTKPEPVIPPEYPRLAESEANALGFQTGLFCGAIDLLRYVGMGATEESAVPASLKQVAESGAAGVETVSGSTADQLDPLRGGDQEPLGSSEVAQQVRGLAGESGDKIAGLAGKNAAQIADILSGRDDGIPASSIPKWLRDIAEATGGDIAAKARTIVILMEAWKKMMGYEPPPGSELSGTYGDLAKEQGGKLEVAAGEASQGLDDFGPPAEPDDSRVHVVQADETIQSIAILWGLGAGLWKEIWEHPANDDLRLKREAPDKIQPEDEIYVPEMPVGRDWVEIILLDAQGEPWANQPYRVVPSSGGPRSGTLDVEGCALEEGLAPGMLEVRFPKSLPGPQDDGGGAPLGPDADGDDGGGGGRYDGPGDAAQAPVQVGGGALELGEAWVKFRVVDDLSDEPLAGVTVTIKLPDGTEEAFTTNADGMIEVDGMPAGKFAIEAISDGEAYEVIDLS